MAGDEPEAADRIQSPGVLGANVEEVPVDVAELRARQAEDLDDDAELEWRHPIEGEHGDAMRRHG